MKIDYKGQEYRKGYTNGYREGVAVMQKYYEELISRPPPVMFAASELKKFIGIESK